MSVFIRELVRNLKLLRSEKMKQKFSAVLIFCLAFACSGCVLGTTPGLSNQQSLTGSGTNTNTSVVISRNVPAYASSGNASDANSDNYDAAWRSNGTHSWLTYDLSHVPQARRNAVLLVWYNPSYNYDNTLIKSFSYNVPQDYTIDVNPAPAAANPPDSGWITRVKVTGSHYHSRQHVIDMRGDNWVRINVTAVDGASENYDVKIKMDVYDASYALANDWIFYGDSITAGSMVNYTTDGVPGFSQLIHNQVPDQFPVQEDGGIGYLTSVDGANYLPTWLALFPGKYVALSYGTNDAIGCRDPNAFWGNYVTMVQAVLKSDKIPIIPHIPWGRMSNLQACVPLLNAKIDALYQAFPRIVKGPDLWSFFKSHQNLISSDNIHPTDAGIAAYRQQWTAAMLAVVYTHR